MTSLAKNLNTAIWSYLAPMSSARALRVSIGIATLFVLVIMAGVFSGIIDRAALTGVRTFAVIPGLPIAAVLLSEMALRDGITHRTLLYPLIGPVPRPILAIVRTIMTALLLAAGTLAVVVFLRLFERPGWDSFPTEFLAIVFGSLAYVALFGVFHLVARWSLITGLAVLFLLDLPIGMLPFSLRSVAPSYHLRVLADLVKSLNIPVSLNLPDASAWGSSLFLIVLAAICIGLSAVLFSRKNLGELC